MPDPPLLRDSKVECQPSAWSFFTGCLLLILVGSGFSAWKFETPIYATHRLRAQCRISLREADVRDLKLIDDRGRTGGKQTLTDVELEELRSAFERQMGAMKVEPVETDGVNLSRV